MTESSIVFSTMAPITRSRIARDLTALGLGTGDTVMVHASLKSLGWVCGGAQTVILALLDVLGEGGTLVMPTHSTQLTDPAKWQAPPVPESWWPDIRAEMPPYDPARTPTRNMGVIPELFRTWPGVRRSAHPNVSLAALDPQAAYIIDLHAPDDPFGDASPYARLCDMNAKILMLGVGYDTCTLLHVAERRVATVFVTDHAPMMVDGSRQWVEYRVHEMDSDRFPELAPGLDGSRFCMRGKVGQAEARLLQSQAMGDAAYSMMTNQPPSS
jgi:aminoglycoside 3-N-acetyltransferase